MNYNYINFNTNKHFNINQNNICNNCGKYGHLFNQCKLPIISYGIIAFRYNKTIIENLNDKTINENFNDKTINNYYEEKIKERDKENNIEYLMIRRKDSFGFIDFVRGKYSLNNIIQLQNIIDEMSNYEKEKILNLNFNDLWVEMFGRNNKYKNEENISSKKFELIKKGFILGEQNDLLTSSIFGKKIVFCKNCKIKIENENNEKEINLEKMIKQSNTFWNETEWEFPKGRKMFKETDLECALREFEEETGIKKQYLQIIENILPFEETFIGSNYKSYKHKYYLAFIKDDVNLSNFQKSEVSNLEWKNINNCLRDIRPYNFDKINLIININKVLQEYRLYI